MRKGFDMKMLLLGGNAGAWSAKDRAKEADYMSGIEAWVFAFDGIYCGSRQSGATLLVDQCDLIIANSNLDRVDTLRELQRNRNTKNKWVTLIEGGMHDYLRPTPKLLDLLNGSDLVAGINRHATDYFQKMLSTRYEYIGIPYPAEKIRARFGPAKGKDIVLPTWLRDAYPSLLASLKFGEERKIPIHGIESMEERSVFPIPREVTLHHGMGMSDYLGWLSKTAHVFVDLDRRYTWKRNVLDCAAIGIPCISTRSGGQGEEFFPELTVEDCFATESAAQMLRDLYDYPHIWREQATVPIEKFESLRPEAMKAKLLACL
jgi:hypothetical protein